MYYVKTPDKNGIRLNFSYPSTNLIEEGIKRLMQAIKEEYDKSVITNQNGNIKPII